MTVSGRAIIFGSALMAMCLGPRPGAHALDLDQPAPNFTAQDVAGLAVSLEDYKDRKHVVLVFYLWHD